MKDYDASENFLKIMGNYDRDGHKIKDFEFDKPENENIEEKIKEETQETDNNIFEFKPNKSIPISTQNKILVVAIIGIIILFCSYVFIKYIRVPKIEKVYNANYELFNNLEKDNSEVLDLDLNVNLEFESDNLKTYMNYDNNLFKEVSKVNIKGNSSCIDLKTNNDMNVFGEELKYDSETFIDNNYNYSRSDAKIKKKKTNISDNIYEIIKDYIINTDNQEKNLEYIQKQINKNYYDYYLEDGQYVLVIDDRLCRIIDFAGAETKNKIKEVFEMTDDELDMFLGSMQGTVKLELRFNKKTLYIESIKMTFNDYAYNNFETVSNNILSSVLDIPGDINIKNFTIYCDINYKKEEINKPIFAK